MEAVDNMNKQQIILLGELMGDEYVKGIFQLRGLDSKNLIKAQSYLINTHRDKVLGQQAVFAGLAAQSAANFIYSNRAMKALKSGLPVRVRKVLDKYDSFNDLTGVIEGLQ